MLPVYMLTHLSAPAAVGEGVSGRCGSNGARLSGARTGWLGGAAVYLGNIRESIKQHEAAVN